MALFTVEHNSSMRGALTTFNYTPVTELTDVVTVMSEVRSVLRNDILNELTRLQNIKWHVACRVRFVKTIVDADSRDEIEVTKDAVFHGRCHTLLTDDDDVDLLIDLSYDKILESVAKFTRDGSGWTVDSIRRVELIVGQYRPLAASSFIRTPPKIATTRAVVNVNNTGDQMCFLWSVLAHLHPQQLHKGRVSTYRPYTNSVKMFGIEYPVSIRSVNKFEHLNPSISVNVFGCDDKKQFTQLELLNIKAEPTI